LALWLSYSRGAIIALAISALVTAWTMRRSRVRVRAAQATAAALLCAWLLWPAAGRAQDELDGYRLPEISESGIGYSQREFLETQASLSEIDIEGTRRSLGELANVDSLSERVTYWQVGLRMLADNPWTGVGLGNFKQAYMSYQFLGAGDVEAAHNDYLQYFCETGLAGGSLFLAFWVYFGVWGARRILGEEDAAARRWLAGLYAGALAFARRFQFPESGHRLAEFCRSGPVLRPRGAGSARIQRDRAALEGGVARGRRGDDRPDDDHDGLRRAPLPLRPRYHAGELRMAALLHRRPKDPRATA
jgi:hypothetical protein